MKTPRRHHRIRLAGGRIQPLILLAVVLSAAGLASVSGPPEVPARVVRALGSRHPSLLTGRLERTLPPDIYMDLAAPPTPEELARLPGYTLPTEPEPELQPEPQPETGDTQAESDYENLWERKVPFPPRWQPR